MLTDLITVLLFPFFLVYHILDAFYQVFKDITKDAIDFTKAKKPHSKRPATRSWAQIERHRERLEEKQRELGY